MKCKYHPKYRGIRHTARTCARCKIVRGLYLIAQAVGYGAAKNKDLINGVPPHPDSCLFEVQRATPQQEEEMAAHLSKEAATPRIGIPSAADMRKIAADLNAQRPGVNTRRDDYLFVGGPEDGQTLEVPCGVTAWSCNGSTNDTHTYNKVHHPVADTYFFAHFSLDDVQACASYSCLIAGGELTVKVSSRALTQADMDEPWGEPGEGCKHDFGKPLPQYKTFLFIGGPAHGQTREVALHTELPLLRGAAPMQFVVADGAAFFLYLLVGFPDEKLTHAYVLGGHSLEAAHALVQRFILTGSIA